MTPTELQEKVADVIDKADDGDTGYFELAGAALASGLLVDAERFNTLEHDYAKAEAEVTRMRESVANLQGIVTDGDKEAEELESRLARTQEALRRLRAHPNRELFEARFVGTQKPSRTEWEIIDAALALPAETKETNAMCAEGLHWVEFGVCTHCGQKDVAEPTEGETK